MGYRKTNVELDALTLERAQQHAALPELPGERDQKLGRLAWLRQKISDGKFCGTTWAIAIDMETGTIYRADGQHSSIVLTTLPDTLTFPAGLFATVETYEMDSMKDAAEVFELFNNPASVRTNKDKMGIFKAAFEAISNLDRGMLVTIANGIALYEAGLPNGRLFPPRERGHYFDDEKYQRFALFVNSLKGSIHEDLLGKAGLVAEMAADFFTDSALAEEFWNLVLNESHKDNDHETRELARALKEMTGTRRYTAENFRKKAQLVWKRYVRVARSTPTLMATVEPQATAAI